MEQLSHGQMLIWCASSQSPNSRPMCHPAACRSFPEVKGSTLPHSTTAWEGILIVCKVDIMFIVRNMVFPYTRPWGCSTKHESTPSASLTTMRSIPIHRPHVNASSLVKLQPARHRRWPWLVWRCLALSNFRLAAVTAGASHGGFFMPRRRHYLHSIQRSIQKGSSS